MKGQPRFFSSLEMLILSLRKEGKKGEEDEAASEDHAPKKSPRPERRDSPAGNASPSTVAASAAAKAVPMGSPLTPKSPRVQALMGDKEKEKPAPVAAPIPVADEKARFVFSFLFVCVVLIDRGTGYFRDARAVSGNESREDCARDDAGGG